jgi:citrate lyase subunit beta/citryl-CoA lyase
VIDFDISPASLFCPGDQDQRFQKAISNADLVIIDLEDGVGSDRKDLARANMVSSGLDPSRVIVRINPPGTPHHTADLRALRDTEFNQVMLPKAESRSAVESIVGFDVIAIVETVGGVVAARQVASANNVVGMVWGAEDLTASLGGLSSRFEDGRYRDFARFARA